MRGHGYGLSKSTPSLRELVLLKPDVVVYQFFINEFSEVNLTDRSGWKASGSLEATKPAVGPSFEHSQLRARWNWEKMLLRERITESPGTSLRQFSSPGILSDG